MILKLVIEPVVATTQRRYEYEADGIALHLSYGPSLITALRRMSAFEGGRTGWEQMMSATHPPTELRIEALQLPKLDDEEYTEDELKAPTGQEILRIFGSLFGRR